MKPRCDYCDGDGWIETDNNGPIVTCPLCNPKSAREIEYERALLQRAIERKP